MGRDVLQKDPPTYVESIVGKNWFDDNDIDNIHLWHGNVSTGNWFDDIDMMTGPGSLPGTVTGAGIPVVLSHLSPTGRGLVVGIVAWQW